MSASHIQGLIPKGRVTEAEVAEIQQLIMLCDAHDHLRTRLLLTMVETRPENVVNDFLYYEDGVLVGYLAMDSYGNKEKEVVALVHPDYRRRGIFRSLVQAALIECKQREIERMIFVCQRDSVSGQAVMHRLGARLDFSEHEMVLGTFKPRGQFDDHLVFRQATIDDLDKIVMIMLTNIDNEEFLRRHVAEVFRRSGNPRFFLSLLGEEPVGCEEPVGTLRLEEIGTDIGLYGFVVRPDYRGRGYGRQMLEEAILTVRSEGQKNVMLDVDVTNTNALGLYLSVGFEIRATYEYYAHTVS